MRAKSLPEFHNSDTGCTKNKDFVPKKQLPYEKYFFSETLHCKKSVKIPFYNFFIVTIAIFFPEFVVDFVHLLIFHRIRNCLQPFTLFS